MQEHVRAVRVIYKLDFVDFRIFLVELKHPRRLNAISLRLLLQKKNIIQRMPIPNLIYGQLLVTFFPIISTEKHCSLSFICIKNKSWLLLLWQNQVITMAKLRPTQFFNHTKEKALSSKQCVEIFIGVILPSFQAFHFHKYVQ